MFTAAPPHPPHPHAVQAAAKMILLKGKLDPPVLKTLHWVPVSEEIWKGGRTVPILRHVA